MQSRYELLATVTRSKAAAGQIITTLSKFSRQYLLKTLL